MLSQSNSIRALDIVKCLNLLSVCHCVLLNWINSGLIKSYIAIVSKIIAPVPKYEYF